MEYAEEHIQKHVLDLFKLHHRKTGAVQFAVIQLVTNNLADHALDFVMRRLFYRPGRRLYPRGRGARGPVLCGAAPGRRSAL